MPEPLQPIEFSRKPDRPDDEARQEERFFSEGEKMNGGLTEADQTETSEEQNDFSADENAFLNEGEKMNGGQEESPDENAGADPKPQGGDDPVKKAKKAAFWLRTVMALVPIGYGCLIVFVICIPFIFIAWCSDNKVDCGKVIVETVWDSIFGKAFK